MIYDIDNYLQKPYLTDLLGALKTYHIRLKRYKISSVDQVQQI